MRRPIRALDRVALGAAISGLAVALAPATGLSQDDGGTRSVFAEGAGNRALGLGGAYVAIADDASAPIWNPGGLGFVSRREVQASHTNLFGLGFSEQYVSAVLPSWRLGTMSVTARSFGVDGIEERDDRNLLVGESLRASELEVALGFGRRLGEIWGLGGAVKLQRQSIAGASDVGIGLDLGAKTLPLAALGSTSILAERLSLGLSVRNAIAPKVRLDQESVADPAVLRTGLGYRQPVGSEGSLLWALDLESTGDMSPRVHAGVELSLVTSLALRGGLAGGELRAGLGARLGDIGIDYAFEDNPLGNIHRFGVVYAFGATVDEQRDAYLAAEEEKLQSSLAEAFEERTRARVDRLMTQAERAIAAGRGDEALETAAILEVLAPADERIASIEERALLVEGLAAESRDDLAGAVVALGRAAALGNEEAGVALERVQAKLASRTATSNEVRQLMRSALESLASDDLAGARAGFQEVLRREPDDAEAGRMLARTEDAITRRVSSLLDQSRTLARAGLFDDADERLNDALSLSPANGDIDETARMIRRLRDEREALRARAEVPAASESAPSSAPGEPAADDGDDRAERRPLSEEEQRQMENLYRLGLEAAAENRIDDAIRYWEFVWTAAPDYADVAEHLEREYLARGMEAFASGRLDEAVAQWNNVLRIDPDDERAGGYLRRAREQDARFREIVRDSRVAETED